MVEYPTLSSSFYISISDTNEFNTSYGRNLPLSSDDEQQMENNDEQDPGIALAIVLTCCGILFCVVIVVVIWIYARKRKGQNDIKLEWRASLGSNKVCITVNNKYIFNRYKN